MKRYDGEEAIGEKDFPIWFDLSVSGGPVYKDRGLYSGGGTIPGEGGFCHGAQPPDVAPTE